MNRVVINGRFLSRPLTGVERVAHEVIRALASVSDTTQRDLLPKIEVLTPPGLGISELYGFTVRPVGRLRGQAWEQLELPIHSGGAPILNLCNTASIFTTRNIVTIHDDHIYRYPASYPLALRLWYRLIQPIAARRSLELVTVSNHSKSALMSRRITSRRGIAVIHNGADHIARVRPETAVLTRLGLRAQGYLLAVGSLAPHKNLALLSTLALSGNAADLPIVITGRASAPSLNNVKLDRSQVKLAGSVADEELKALYANAFAVLVPSLAEGFGFAAVEAMRCGTPTIVSSSGALPEIVGDGAIVADPSDPEQWGAHIRSLRANPEQREGLAARGLAVSSRYVWVETARRYLALIERSHRGQRTS